MANEILVPVAIGAAKILAKKFGSAVIERWSNYRAKSFFEGFCDRLEEDLATHKIQPDTETMLNQILADENKSSALFDAYRSVSLAKSKTIGPRIIGILTATIINRDGLASSLEEDIFEASEQMTDGELIEFSEYYKSVVNDLNNKSPKVEQLHDCMEVLVAKEELDSNWKQNSPVGISPVSLKDNVGSWALRMRNIGLISERLDEETFEYQEDGERHIDQDGSIRRLKSILVLPLTLTEFSILVDRATTISLKDQP